MRHIMRHSAPLLLCLSLSCGGDGDKGSSDTSGSGSDTSGSGSDTSGGDDSGSDTSSVERADCDIPLDGLDWGTSPVIDYDPEIAAKIDAVDFAAMDEEITIGGLAALYRGGIAFALEVGPGELGGTLNRDETLAKGHLGRVVLASLGEDPSTMDYTLYRQGLQRYYTCSKGFPMTLEGFERVYGDIPEEYTDIDSKAKCSTRRLRLSPETGVYVAESLWEGEVRETEILLTQNRTDGQIDFVVYGADGVLTDRSQFPTIGGGSHLVTSAPYTCMTCHMNPDAAPGTWGYDVLIPSTGPCAR
jgi:hypothetical protein